MPYRSTQHDRPRAAFTLLEIMIVLALMVVMAASAVPMYRSTLKNERLRKAARSIAADWTRTRAKAMQAGETQMWLCTLADGRYSTSAYQNGLSAAEATGVASQLSGVSSNGSNTGDFGQNMPEGISIDSVLVSEADTVVSMGQTSSSGESGAATLFFYPDGTSSSARVTVSDDEGRSIAVMINGMAGTIRVTPTGDGN